MISKEVSLNLAQLLKQKGYSWETIDFYKKSRSDKDFYLSTGIDYNTDRDCIWDWNLNGGKSGLLSKVIPYPNDDTAIYYSAPTIAQVVDWLLYKHNIWIYIQPQSLIGLYKDREADNWYYTVIHCDRVSSNYYSSPSEAYEKAIEYVLLNLI